VAAKYEYSPFGELLRREGSQARRNPFGWSTQYADSETGLVYYGLRYYSPRLGRFINQDPIKEQGGLNLYGFAGNSPVNFVDVLGLCPTITNILQTYLISECHCHYKEYDQGRDPLESRTIYDSSENEIVFMERFTVTEPRLPVEPKPPVEPWPWEYTLLHEIYPEDYNAANGVDMIPQTVSGNNRDLSGKFTAAEFKSAIDLIKSTKPDYYNYIKTRYSLTVYGNQTDPDKRNASGYTYGGDKTVNINMDYTLAFLQFKGTAAQFLSYTILHESIHIGYNLEGFLRQPGANPAMNEASVRYWIEDWAIKNGIPETISGARMKAGDSFLPNFKQIYDDVVNRDGYSTAPYYPPRQ
jgi:RHS repeat-associated protein